MKDSFSKRGNHPRRLNIKSPLPLTRQLLRLGNECGQEVIIHGPRADRSLAAARVAI